MYLPSQLERTLQYNFVRDGRYSEKGVGVHPPPSPTWAGITPMRECTPESGIATLCIYSVMYPHVSSCLAPSIPLPTKLAKECYLYSHFCYSSLLSGPSDLSQSQRAWVIIKEKVLNHNVYSFVYPLFFSVPGVWRHLIMKRNTRANSR
jgi:hypothetical protein